MAFEQRYAFVVIITAAAAAVRGHRAGQQLLSVRYRSTRKPPWGPRRREKPERESLRSIESLSFRSTQPSPVLVLTLQQRRHDIVSAGRCRCCHA